MSLVWDHFPGGGSELLAMLALADWCNDSGGSLHPSMQAVADKLRVSEKQARRLIHKLEDDGYLSVVGNAYGGAPGTTRNYQLNVIKLQKSVKATPPTDGSPKDEKNTAPTPPVDGRGTAPANGRGTAPMGVTPPMDVTPPTHGRVGLPPVSLDGSHGCPETAPTHGSLTISEPPCEPPVNHQYPLAVISTPNPVVADATSANGKRDPKETALQAACRETWKSFQTAYVSRYGVKHADSAKVRSQVKQFVQRIGYSDAPPMAAWYVGHPGSYYVGQAHCLGALLAKAESLRTEWATGRLMTNARAQQSDKTATNFSAAEEAKAMLRARGVM
jgi:helix-turn-helix protein